MGHRQVVELASDLRNDSRTRVRSTIAADEHHGHQRRIPACEEGEVGTVRPHGIDHANHVRDVAGRILDGHDSFALFRQSLHGRDVNGRRKHGDVVQRHINGRVVANFLEVRINRRRAELVIEGRNDRDGPDSNRRVVLASTQCFVHVGFGRTGQNWHSPTSLVRNDRHNATTFFRSKTSEFAR